MQSQQEPGAGAQGAAQDATRSEDDAEWTAPAFDWKDALIGLSVLYAVAGLMLLVELKLSGRTLVFASLPIVLWAVRTRRRLFPGSAYLVKRGVSLAGLVALLSIIVGSLFGAFGGANALAALNDEPEPVEDYRYQWALNTRISSHKLANLASIQRGDAREEPEGVEAIDLDSLFEEPTPEELKRFEEEARLEVEAEVRAEFEEDQKNEIEAGRNMALFGLGLVLAGALLDALRPRRKLAAQS